MQGLEDPNNKAAITTLVFLCPAVKTDSSIREGLNMLEGLYCYGLPVWECLVVVCFRSKPDLGTISNTETIFCLYYPLCLSLPSDFLKCFQANQPS